MASIEERTVVLDLRCAACEHPQSELRIAGDLVANGSVDITATCPWCKNSVVFRKVAVS